MSTNAGGAVNRSLWWQQPRNCHKISQQDVLSFPVIFLAQMPAFLMSLVSHPWVLIMRIIHWEKDLTYCALPIQEADKDMLT